MLFPGKRTAKAVAAGEVAEEEEKKRRMKQKRRKRSRGYLLQTFLQVNRSRSTKRISVAVNPQLSNSSQLY